MDFQIVKIDGFNEIIPRETSLAVTFELRNIFVQQDRFGQIELITNFLQCLEYLMSASVITGILNAGVFKHMIIFKYLSP